MDPCAIEGFASDRITELRATNNDIIADVIGNLALLGEFVNKPIVYL